MYNLRKRLNERFGYTEEDENSNYASLPAYLRDFMKEFDKLNSPNNTLVKIKGMETACHLWFYSQTFNTCRFQWGV
jgi:hypothetical protein